MQLKAKATPIRLGLMAASCALLGSAGASAQADSDTAQPWQVDTGLLYYKENLGRIQAVEPIVSLTRDYGDDRSINLLGTIDSLTGGSPNGAIAARTAQTFASPSATSFQATPGSKTKLYTTTPGNLPLDPNYHDTRLSGNLSWSRPLDEQNRMTLGGHLSDEHDFLSLAANVNFTHEMDDKNRTLNFGLNDEIDRIMPIGGAPVAGSDYLLLAKENVKKSKSVAGGIFGVTQVMSRVWLAQVNFAYDRSHGYLTDPYKILSVVDGSGAPTDYRYEVRPESRIRRSVYFGNKVALGPTVLDLSYRFGKDSWQIQSNTAEAKLRLDFARTAYLEPHVRWYRQTAAEFYHLYLNEGEALPAYMSSDSRLAAFTATTLGLKLGIPYGPHSEINLRIEQYEQKPTERYSTLGNLQGLDLNPGLKATSVQAGWRFEF